MPDAVATFLSWCKLDLRPPANQPSWFRLALATVVAVVGSLVADEILVAIGKSVFPSTKHYGHFQFSDYGKLTVLGVLVACVGWPIVTRISSAPRWLYLRLAVLITLVLFSPDAYIYLVQKQSARGVFVLVWLHVAIAIVTYNAVVRIAPAGSAATHGKPMPVE
jgi:hypothetical protein